MHTLVALGRKKYKNPPKNYIYTVINNSSSKMLCIEPKSSRLKPTQASQSQNRSTKQFKTLTIDVHAKASNKLICKLQVQVNEERARLVSLRQVISEQIYEEVNKTNEFSRDLMVFEGEKQLSDTELEREVIRFKADRFVVLVSPESSPDTKRKSKSGSGKGLKESLKNNIVGRLFTGLSQDKDKKERDKDKDKDKDKKVNKKVPKPEKSEKSGNSSKLSATRPTSTGPQHKLNPVSRPTDSLMLSPRANRSETSISNKKSAKPNSVQKSSSLQTMNTIKSKKSKRAPPPPPLEVTFPLKSASLTQIKRKAPPIPST